MKKNNGMTKLGYMVLLLCLFCTSQLFAAMCGDVNSDDRIDIVDALLIAQAYVGGYSLPMEVADVNNRGSVDIVDVLLVAQLYVGIIAELPGCPGETGTPTPVPTPIQNPTNPPNQSGITGYTTIDGGTNGGAAGPMVTVTNAEDFKNDVSSHDAYVIQVQGTINLGSQIYVRENKTIIGLGGNAVIIGGLKMSNYYHFILRNLTL